MKYPIYVIQRKLGIIYKIEDINKAEFKITNTKSTHAWTMGKETIKNHLSRGTIIIMCPALKIMFDLDLKTM